MTTDKYDQMAPGAMDALRKGYEELKKDDQIYEHPVEERMSRQVRRKLEREGALKSAVEAEQERVLTALVKNSDPNSTTEPHGRRNIYVCDKCFGHIVTADLCEGVTPFIVKCRATPGCDGSMQSSMYRVFDQRMRPTFEWYRPAPAEIADLKPGAKEHVDKGGLLLRLVLSTDRGDLKRRSAERDGE